MSGISTHVLDTARGRPAAGIRVHLSRGGVVIGSRLTGEDGRISSLLPAGTPLQPGRYLLVFETGSYYPEAFFPEVSILFEVRDAESHHHVPLLISPFGYTTYRGS
ncbi:MAG: hydroxyisourate hydrolase [Acidobacteriaceae bacterium]|nr:hydroxyisourate hydrolase [Acidobacteriaceae bacterium]